MPEPTASRNGGATRVDAGPEPAVAVTDLTVTYGSTTVLDGVDLRVPTGTALALTGENGVGKSTLLRCVTGLQEPSGGEVVVLGGTPGRGVAFWRQVATTVESPTWYHGLTVREHLDLVRVANGGDPADGRIDEVSTLLGIDALADSLPITLSSGQRQRFLLAATFVRPSRLLVLDEPEQRLDTTVKRALADHLRAYVTAGGTLLMASHDEQFWRDAGATQVVLRRPEA
ncbi:ABC transporter ATP-binding protein [Micromonospora sp. WMMD812]|uniref:ABC transporter ATP-binding protein n=1 Tax=Micromonospora sp. WMMD812 TaxID=3015152 RepID=UPI00248BA0B7|nr:ABC transporter ATP-binding protein [Micromonospora sp. WMMD812]WBB70718.1 ABC transporter ATP-binding protein [Micromonospora sp. WMMD812]